jgi:hypothetical protein
MADAPFWSGRNAKFVWIIDSKKVDVFPKTWSVKQNATVYADDVGGEDRDRPGKIINHYDWTMSLFQKDLSVLKALLGYDAKIDTLTIPFEVGAGILIYPMNGTKAAFEGREITIDDWNFQGNPGRTERGMLDVPFRSRYFEEAPTI